MELSTPAEIVAEWQAANLAKRDAEKRLTACKAALKVVDCPIGRPLYSGLGLVKNERRNYEFDVGMLEAVLPAGILETVMTVNKTALKNYMEEEGVELEGLAEKVKEAEHETGEPTVFYTVKKIKES